MPSTSIYQIFLLSCALVKIARNAGAKIEDRTPLQTCFPRRVGTLYYLPV